MITVKDASGEIVRIESGVGSDVTPNGWLRVRNTYGTVVAFFQSWQWVSDDPVILSSEQIGETEDNDPIIPGRTYLSGSKQRRASDTKGEKILWPINRWDFFDMVASGEINICEALFSSKFGGFYEAIFTWTRND